MALLELDGVSKSFGAIKAVTDVKLSIEPSRAGSGAAEQGVET